MTLAAFASTDELVDFYPTPHAVTARLLRQLRPTLKPNRILEPAAGAGSMLGPLRACWSHAWVEAYDIAPQSALVQARAFWFDDEPGGYDLVITNPPFSLCCEFVDYGLGKLAPGGALVLLMPLALMCGKKRASWWPERKPHHVYPLASRPSFVRSEKSTTDMKDYAWYVWRNTGRKHATQITWGL